MALDVLPKELLLMITDYLPTSTIESLALTFNKQITTLCLPRLQALFTRRRHVRSMVSRFGDYRLDSVVRLKHIEENLEKFDIPATSKLFKPSAMERVERLQYLNFRGDLDWLIPIDKETAKRMEGYNNTSSLTAQQFEDLRAVAKSLNITFPSSFLKLFADKKLQAHVPDSTSCCFDASSGLRKVPASIDQGAGGYSISVYVDQQDYYHWILYIEPGTQGSHCVLASAFDSGMDWDDISEDEIDYYAATKEERQSDKSVATMMKSEVCLGGFGFEEWLAMTYFEQWLWFVCLNDYEPEEELKEYVRRMYVREE